MIISIIYNEIMIGSSYTIIRFWKKWDLCDNLQNMFKKITPDILTEFRLIYHQTTGYSNPIIEAVLYQNRGGGAMYFWDDLTDGNYIIFHRFGFGHININEYHNSKSPKEIDDFLKNTPDIPDRILLYNTPAGLLDYWKTQDKQYFKIRKRRRYQIDEQSFHKLDKDLYKVPEGCSLKALQECPIEDLNKFEMRLDSNYYDSMDDFLQNSFGFVLYDQNDEAACIAYLICKVGARTECDLKTLPQFLKNGYGFITITNYVAESFRRKIDVGWDCFVENYTNKWVEQYGYSHIIREYDFVSFLK